MNSFEMECLKAEDPVVFSELECGWTPDKIQADVLRSDSRKIICLCHRQWGKSTTIALKALNRAIYWPRSLILIASSTQDQSKELFRKVLDFTGRIPSINKIEDSKQYMTLANGSRIVSLCGKESTVRGYSAPDIVIIDEASRVIDETFVALSPMLAMSQGQLIMISTPWGKRGFFFHVWEEGGGLWERHFVIAEENQRIMEDPDRRAWLENERKTLSDRMFRQEYRCEFVEQEDVAFSYDLIQASLVDDGEPFFKSALVDGEKPFDFKGL